MINGEQFTKIHFEKQGIIGKIFNPLRLFFLNLLICLPFRWGIKIFIKTSKHTNRIRKYARTFKALEIMYCYPGLNFDEGFWEGLATWFWERILLNPRALRNRLKLMKKEFALILDSFRGKPARILSLASGSGRGIIEVMSAYKNELDFQLIFLDRSLAALAFSQKLGEEAGLSENLIRMRSDLNSFLTENSGTRYDAIELVGFLDYLDKNNAINLFRKIYWLLNEGGYLIAANVKNNPEKKFLDEIVNWKMFYRDEKDLRELLKISGFGGNYCKIIYEPMNIHGLIIAKKC